MAFRKNSSIRSAEGPDPGVPHAKGRGYDMDDEDQLWAEGICPNMIRTQTVNREVFNEKRDSMYP